MAFLQQFRGRWRGQGELLLRRELFQTADEGLPEGQGDFQADAGFRLAGGDFRDRQFIHPEDIGAAVFVPDHGARNAAFQPDTWDGKNGLGPKARYQHVRPRRG